MTALALFAAHPGAAVFLVSVAFTLAHTLEEVLGDGAPFWDYASDLTGIRASWVVGAIGFAVLAAALVGVAAWGYLYRDAAALALLAGLRAGDAVASHLGLWALYKRPNPGLATVPLYLAELLFLAILWGELAGVPLPLAWFAAGFGLFAVPWAALLVLRFIKRG